MLRFHIEALLIDPTAPGTLYAALGYEGIHKSTDGGATWNTVNTGLDDRPYLRTLAMDPANSRILYAGGVSNGVIFKSTNGGASWTAARSGVPESAGEIKSLVVHLTEAGTVYAAANRDVYKSTNGGESWTAASTGLGRALMEELVIDRRAPDTLYAATHDGVFKSTNAAASWSLASTGLVSRITYEDGCTSA